MALKDNELQLPNGKIITLNEQQFSAYIKILAWLASGKYNFFTLTGYAGTGKTTTVKKILDKYKRGVVVSAPTHKAKKVIINSSGRDGLTLHGLLGLRPDVDLENFNPNNPIFNPIALPKIHDYNFVVIDEASMINKKLYQLIQETIKGTKTKVLFVGDAGQIPPINERLSVIFDQPEDYIFNLTKIERQNDSNPLGLYYDALRDNLNRLDGGIKRISNINEIGEGIQFLVNRREFRREVINKFKSIEFKKDTDFVKIIAWRNNTVNGSNTVVRNALFGRDSGIVEVNDLLMGYRSIMDAKQRYNIIENSADYLVTKKSELCDNPIGLQGYNVQIRENLPKGGLSYKDIFILDTTIRDNAMLYGEMHDYYRDMAKSDKRKWKYYYEFRRNNIIMSDIELYRNGIFRDDEDIIKKDLGYGYAITAHKCISENSNILTKDGNVKLKNINIGDYVCVGSNKHRKVVNKFYSGIKKSYRLKTKCGYFIECSEDHRILDSSLTFKPLKDFKIGEIVPINRNNDEFKLDLDFNSISIDYLLGLLVADGSYGGNIKKEKYRIDLTIGGDDVENINKVRRFYENESLNYKIYKKKKSRVKNIYVSNKNWRNYLLELGLGYDVCENKKAPNSVLNGTKQQKSDFIRGLFDGDGSVNTKCIRFVNNSLNLIKSVQDILLEFGIISYYKKRKKSYTLTIVNTSIDLYRKYISFGLYRKREILNNINVTSKTNIDFIPNKDEIFNLVKSELKQKSFYVKNKGLNPSNFKRFPDHLKHLSYGNLNHIIELYNHNKVPVNNKILELNDTYYFYDSIESIEYVGNVKMFDLEIDEIHQFIADGFVVHNCQGSTYQHVMVMESDINNNMNIEERNRIKYVALTRPSISATVFTTKLD